MIRMTRALLVFLGAAGAFGPSFGADEELGRLFFSAERRAALDRARQFNIEEQQVTQQNVLTVEGVVTRSSGRSTAWVNGVAVTETGNSGMEARPDLRRSSVHVRSANEPTTSVTVGTAHNRTTGERIDPLGGGFVARSTDTRRP